MAEKKLNTKEISNLTIEKYGDKIEKACAEHGCLKSWSVMKNYIKITITEKYGKRKLNELSGQFIGYAAHYIFAAYVSKYKR